MTSMRYGLKLSRNATIDQLWAVWRIADEAGFDHCWRMDHFATLGARDDGADLRGVARCWSSAPPWRRC